MILVLIASFTPSHTYYSHEQSQPQEEQLPSEEQPPPQPEHEGAIALAISSSEASRLIKILPTK
jgi:hypothetical protein